MWGQRLNQLSETQRQEVWLRFDEGSATVSELARRFAVSKSTISRTVSDRRQRRNVCTVPDEKTEESSPRSEQREISAEGPRKSEQDNLASVAQGSQRQSGRSSEENAANGHATKNIQRAGERRGARGSVGEKSNS